MENRLDKLFKSKLEGHEEEFSIAAWDKMQAMLDDKSSLNQNKGSKRRRRLIFLLLFFVGVGMLGSYSYYQKIDAKPIATSSIEHPDIKDVEQNLINKSTESIAVELPNFAKSDIAPSSESIPLQASSAALISTSKSIENDWRSTTLSINENLSKPSSFKIVKPSLKNINPDVSISSQIISSLINQNTENITILEDHSRILEDSSVENLHTSKTPNASSVFEESKDEINYNSLVNNRLNATGLKLVAFIPMLSRRISRQPALLFIPTRQPIDLITQTQSKHFGMGMGTIVRYNNGLGFQIGPYFSYAIGRFWSIESGLCLDGQNLKNGPSISVYDKVYSFGSTLVKRDFTLSNAYSIGIPLKFTRHYNGASISAGIQWNKTLQAIGSISGEGGETGPIVSTSIENENLKTSFLAYHLGISMNVHRYIDLSLNLEYRNSLVKSAGASFYPSIGLNYRLINL